MRRAWARICSSRPAGNGIVLNRSSASQIGLPSAEIFAFVTA